MSESFDVFWSKWPDNGKGKFFNYCRKKDKKKCREKWERELESKAQGIIYNVEQRSRFDKAWLENGGKYLEAPLVYLNNERWDDGGFADVRDIRREPEKNSAPRQDFDEGPNLSRYGRAANKMLLRLITRCGGICDYPENAGELWAKTHQPPDPLDPVPLNHVLLIKSRIVADAEEALSEGDAWSDDEFLDVLENGLKTAIDEARSGEEERTAATA